ncbi:MAG: dockerin type I domain-containing protein [Ruminococcus flavefaciens]|nr:dockerin type I domain-containing protein [Ruminococcus flavefaciens]MCM1228970.1 dockerin type I domain-containing protein [Ruminococcus flavefaciens]
MGKFFRRIFMTAVSFTAVYTGIASANAFADWKQLGFLGDLNNDNQVSIADAVIMTKHLLGESKLTSSNGYDVKGKVISIDGGEGFLAKKFLETADLNQDGRVDVYDMIMLRRYIISQTGIPVLEWIEEPATTTASTTATTSTTTTTTVTASENFINPPIYDLYGSMPSQGEARTVIFYVDFPDCKYSYLPSTEQIENIAFGSENEDDGNYPFESMSAFYKRSSKGAMNLTGEAYTYTAKNNKSYYEGDVWHVSLIDEIIAEFDSTVDFSQFDGDNDKIIDSILISVPESAGDDNWWASAGMFGGDSRNRADGMDIGHVIVGNAEIKSADNYSNFNSSYLHEMGHCMGLPDYYLYGVEDFQGMHGSAGFELMDDAICDFGAVSKLMLGWYKPEQIQVYNENMGSKTFTLTEASLDDSGCLIIPCGELDENYYSEFFILEYAGLKKNNSGLTGQWWRATGEGVRAYHVSAEVTGDMWYNTFRYSSGNDTETNYNNGRRFIRLVGEGTDSTDNYYGSGDVIDSSVPEFNWYDSDGNMTINPGITVKIGEVNADTCTVTVSTK